MAPLTMLVLLALALAGDAKATNGSRERATACKVIVKNVNGVFLLQVAYKDPSGGAQSQSLAYGISAEFEAGSGTSVSLKVLLGGTVLRELPPALCAKGPVHIDCTGPTIWNFACTQPHN